MVVYLLLIASCLFKSSSVFAENEPAPQQVPFQWSDFTDDELLCLIDYCDPQSKRNLNFVDSRHHDLVNWSRIRVGKLALQDLNQLYQDEFASLDLSRLPSSIRQIYVTLTPARIRRITKVFSAEEITAVSQSLDQAFAKWIGWQYPFQELNPRSALPKIYLSSRWLAVRSALPWISQELANRLFLVAEQNQHEIFSGLAGAFPVWLLERDMDRSTTDPYFWRIYRKIQFKQMDSHSVLSTLVENPLVQSDLLEQVVKEIQSRVSSNQILGDDDYQILKSILSNPNLSQDLFDQIFAMKAPRSIEGRPKKRSGSTHVRFAAGNFVSDISPFRLCPSESSLYEALASHPRLTLEQQNQLFDSLQNSRWNRSHFRWDIYRGLARNLNTSSEIIRKIDRQIQEYPADERDYLHLLINFSHFAPKELLIQHIFSSLQALSEVVKKKVSFLSIEEWKGLLESSQRLEAAEKRLDRLIYFAMNPEFPRKLRYQLYLESKKFQDPTYRYALLMALIVST